MVIITLTLIWWIGGLGVRCVRVCFDCVTGCLLFVVSGCLVSGLMSAFLVFTFWVALRGVCCWMLFV